MSTKNQTPKIKKERVQSVPMNGKTLEEIGAHLKEANFLIDSLENSIFVMSIHKNTDMAVKKVNARLFGAKKKMLINAIREGKEVQIIN